MVSLSNILQQQFSSLHTRSQLRPNPHNYEANTDTDHQNFLDYMVKKPWDNAGIANQPSSFMNNIPNFMSAHQNIAKFSVQFSSQQFQQSQKLFDSCGLCEKRPKYFSAKFNSN